MATTGGNGNGERFEIKVGSKSLGITTKDLVSVLFIIGAFTGWWLTIQHLTAGQERILAGQERGFASIQQVLEKQNAHQAILLDVVHTNRKELMEVAARQNTLLHEQTVALREAVEDQTKDLNEKLETLNWNVSHDAAQHLPLGRRNPDR